MPQLTYDWSEAMKEASDWSAYHNIVRVLGPDSEGVGVGAVMHWTNLVNLK